MLKQRHPFYIRRFLKIFFFASLIITLWLGAFTKGQVHWGNVVIAQAPIVEQQVQLGWERYQLGDYGRAIELWQQALKLYQGAKNPANEAIVLENLAIAYQQLGQGEEAIRYWQQVIPYYRQQRDWKNLGRSLTELAQTYNSIGQPRQAIALLCGISQPDLNAKPSADEDLEQLPNCAKTEDSAWQLAKIQPKQELEIAVLGTLAESYRLIGGDKAYRQTIDLLEESKQKNGYIHNTIKHYIYLSSILNNLGNAYNNLALINYHRANLVEQIGDNAEKLKKQALQNDATALDYFQQALQLAYQKEDKLTQMRTLLNSIPLHYRKQDLTAANQALKKAQELLHNLPKTRETVYAAIQIANFLEPISPFENSSFRLQCPSSDKLPQAQKLLEQAVNIAQNSLGDSRSESFALGELGHTYECGKNYDIALNLTQKARLLADQNLQAKDSLYLWEWQAARIYLAQNQEYNALRAYERAISSLQSIRSELLGVNRDIQFDFRDTINPLYREFIQLRLERAELIAKQNKNDSKQNQKHSDFIVTELDSALQTLDALQLAELQNYFGNNCVLSSFNTKSLNQLIKQSANTGTAFFSSIILQDPSSTILKNRTAVLVTLPNGQTNFQWIQENNNFIDSKTLKAELNSFRKGLESKQDTFEDYQQEYLPQSQKIYNWLVRPFVDDLKRAQVKTLVFIQDGIFRTVPMSALHDGQKFLVENYAIAITPSLSLTNPKTFNRQNLRGLLLGLSTEAIVDGQQEPALEKVLEEIKQVNNQLSGSKQLLNPEFTRNQIQKALRVNYYPIIHIATHGKFGAEPEDRWLVTGEKSPKNQENEKLSINVLEKILRNLNPNTQQVDLLTLTACQTAVGDDRAALGLAGIAVQAGVRSALASLWFISDASTAKISAKFYEKLKDTNLNLAEALREAQVALIHNPTNNLEDYRHPYHWAAFVLIGNWL